MPLSDYLKDVLEETSGFSTEEIITSQPELLGSISHNFVEEQQGINGRGYVNFGKTVSPSAKDKENLKILGGW